MPDYLAHEIDPETIRISVDVPFMEHLSELIYRARNKARASRKVVAISHYTKVEEPLIAGDTPTTSEMISFRDYEPEFFAKGVHQCPQNADADWEQQHKQARPFPSILVDESGAVAVAKPGLCDGCVHNLHRKTQGHCTGLRFTPLLEVQQ